jgi:hypothetical protein
LLFIKSRNALPLYVLPPIALSFDMIQQIRVNRSPEKLVGQAKALGAPQNARPHVRARKRYHLKLCFVQRKACG